MKCYRSVVVGAGGIAGAHVRAAEATQGRVEITAVVDLDEGRAAKFCEDNGIQSAYTSFDDMLVAEKPDIVQICVPPALHADMSISAMEAGAWVLCEKPLCGSLAELDRISAAEERTGKYTACVFQMRFASSTEHLRKLSASGALGRPLVAVCNTMWYRDEAYYAMPWRGTWKSELGGPTMGHGIHAMDHLLHLLGEWTEVRAVAATLDRDVEVEDVSMALVRFSNGACASIVNSVLSPRQETYIRIDFQRATAELTHLYSYSRENWRFTPAEPLSDEGLMPAWQDAPADVPSTHGAQLCAMVDDLDHERRPLTSGPQARLTLDLLTSIYKSAFTNEVVERGSIKPGDPFYDAIHGNASPVRIKPD